MGYYASGDTRKNIQSSEDDEGYENQVSSTVGLLNLPNAEVSQETPGPSISLISDDTDRPFWAEDELSNSESKHQLNKKQKRRHSFSYRNRITVHRSRSLLFRSSSSSLDSSSEQIAPGVPTQKRFANRLNVERQPVYRKKKM